MIELPRAIPDVRTLLSLTPEELGAKMLFLLRKSKKGTFKPSVLQNELWHQYSPHLPNNPPQYPRNYQDQIDLAIDEAWAWLRAQGLVIPNTQGWYRLSRRAQSMESETDFASFRTSRLLPKEILHPKITDPVWRAFMRGEFDVAVFLAMKAVEVAVRDATGIARDGVKLMREAFQPDSGPLTDINADGGEKQGRMDLFAGAIASFKNPHSHRDVDLNDPVEAIEVIFLANHLLRIVDSLKKSASPKTH